MLAPSLTIPHKIAPGKTLCCLRLLLVAGGIILQSVVCQAGTYLLVRSGDGDIYQRFQAALSKILNEISPENSLVTLDVAAFQANQDAGRYDAVISAGIEASTAVTKSGVQNHIIMSMLPEADFQKRSKAKSIICKTENCRVIYLDQPVSRQLKTIRAALPEATILTVIGSAHSSALREQIAASAPRFGFRIKNIFADSESALLNALQNELAGTDVLMAIPDPIIYNRNTARAILLSTFNQRIPLFAYSSSFIRAGATFGIYSSPEDIARQVAERVCCINKIKSRAIYPKYFTIEVNHHTSEALGIPIMNAASLKQALADHGKK